MIPDYSAFPLRLPLFRTVRRFVSFLLAVETSHRRASGRSSALVGDRHDRLVDVDVLLVALVTELFRFVGFRRLLRIRSR